jgi:hypothetical protein
VTNDAILAILALDIPERQLRFLFALGTFTRGKGGWRQAGMKLLAAKAGGLSPTTAAKARGELVKAGTIEFVRGKGHGLSTYRITLPAIADHLVGADDESTKNAGDLPSTKNAGGHQMTKNAGDPEDQERWRSPDDQPAPRRRPVGHLQTTRPNAPASGNAKHGSYTYGSKDLGAPDPGLNGNAESAPAAAARPAPKGRAARLTDDGPPRPGYGLCPECRDWQVVKATGGRIGRHNAHVRGRYDQCPGSGRPPAEPVPCIRCERTDVALNGYGLCQACRKAIKADEPATSGE